VEQIQLLYQQTKLVVVEVEDILQLVEMVIQEQVGMVEMEHNFLLVLLLLMVLLLDIFLVVVEVVEMEDRGVLEEQVV
jgi:hypothetical protein